MGKHVESSKKSLKPNAASHNNASWYTNTDGFLEHSPSRGSLYYKGSALQKVIPIFWGGPPLVFYKEHNVNYTFFFLIDKGEGRQKETSMCKSCID